MHKKYVTKMGCFLAVLGMISMACNDQSDKSVEASTAEVITKEVKKDSLNINQPSLVKAGADGTLKLTAENGSATGPEIKYMPEWRAFGWFGGSDKVEWEVEVPAAGNYDVYLEWSVSDEEAGKEFVFEAKEKKITGKVASSGSWDVFKSEKVGSIQLSQERQQVVFRPNTKFEKGAILDLREIRLIPVK